MQTKAQIIILCILISVLFEIIYMVKKRELDLKYVLAWITCDLALIILTIFPNLMGKVAFLLGIQSPMNMIFFLCFLFSLIIIFSLTVALSRTTARIRRMAQQIALIEKERKEATKEIVQEEKDQ